MSRTISLLDVTPETYLEAVSSGFGEGGASNADVAAHLMPPMVRLQSVQIEITTYCNFGCQQCGRTKGIAAGTWANRHLSLESYRNILAKLPPTRTITLQGVGEPSMHPNFYELLKIASDSGKFDSIHFNTNAHTHDDDYWKSLAGFHGITVALSVDSLDPRIAEICRSGTDADLLWHRLKLFRDTFQWFIVATVASRLNIDDIETTLRRIGALGGVPLQITRMMSDDEAVLLHDDDEAHLAEIVAGVRRDYPDFKLYFNPGNLGREEDANERDDGSLLPIGKRCVAPFMSPYFTVDGFLTPCCNADSPEHYGRTRADDARDWDALRSSPGVTKWVRSFIEEDPEICRGCSVNPNRVSLTKGR